MSIIVAKDIKTVLASRVIHDGVNFSVNEGEIFGLLGSSGSGKTTLLREMVMLQEFHGGSINILNHEINGISYENSQKLKREWGVLFQAGALFSSLTIAQNIALPLIEYSNLSKKMIAEIVDFKINLVGLKSSDANLFPAQISGGMKKKSALARALAMDPKLLFLDEPTSGLDPTSAREFDALILELRSLLNLTVVMVSHDLKSIYDTIDRVAIIDNKKIGYEGTLKGLESVEGDFKKIFAKENYEQ